MPSCLNSSVPDTPPRRAHRRHFPWVKGIVDRDVGWHTERCRGACNDEMDLGDLILFELVTFGFKPYPWPAVENLPEYGDVGTGRLASGGIQADDLRIYNRALSQSEIMKIATSGIGP